MIVRVQLFARARELAGADMLTVELPDAADVAKLRTAMSAACPALAAFLTKCAIAVDDDFASDDAAVSAASSLAVIPPVSGG